MGAELWAASGRKPFRMGTLCDAPDFAGQFGPMLPSLYKVLTFNGAPRVPIYGFMSANNGPVWAIDGQQTLLASTQSRNRANSLLIGKPRLRCPKKNRKSAR